MVSKAARKNHKTMRAIRWPKVTETDRLCLSITGFKSVFCLEKHDQHRLTVWFQYEKPILALQGFLLPVQANWAAGHSCLQPAGQVLPSGIHRHSKHAFSSTQITTPEHQNALKMSKPDDFDSLLSLPTSPFLAQASLEKMFP